MRRLGAEAASFPPIVAAGAHGALPHAAPRDEVIPAGTLCVVDWGAQLDGYASDCTRTYATGDLDPRDREVYDARPARAGGGARRRAPGPDRPRGRRRRARDHRRRRATPSTSATASATASGLEVHEGPRLSKQGEAALAAGMVVTVEPGRLRARAPSGVRIEDLVVVTDDGAEVVSGLPKELQVVA